jgi:hypothetical protein
VVQPSKFKQFIFCKEQSPQNSNISTIISVKVVGKRYANQGEFFIREGNEITLSTQLKIYRERSFSLQYLSIYPVNRRKEERRRKYVLLASCYSPAFTYRKYYI